MKRKNEDEENYESNKKIKKVLTVDIKDKRREVIRDVNLESSTICFECSSKTKKNSEVERCVNACNDCWHWFCDDCKNKNTIFVHDNDIKNKKLNGLFCINCAENVFSKCKDFNCKKFLDEKIDKGVNVCNDCHTWLCNEHEEEHSISIKKNDINTLFCLKCADNEITNQKTNEITHNGDTKCFSCNHTTSNEIGSETCEVCGVWNCDECKKSGVIYVDQCEDNEGYYCIKCFDLKTRLLIKTDGIFIASGNIKLLNYEKNKGKDSVFENYKLNEKEQKQWENQTSEKWIDNEWDVKSTVDDDDE